MKRDSWIRVAIVGVVLYVLMRVAPTVDGMQAFAFASLYFLGGVCAIAVALSVAEMTVLDLGKKFRDRWFDACGVLDFNGAPCMLPDGHTDREHATAWVECSRDGTIEHRHRFDDVTAEGREEKRRGRGQLPKVSRTGTAAETATK